MPVKASPISTEAPARIPKWSKNDQDFWLDYFQSSTDTVLSAILEDFGGWPDDIDTSRLKDRLKQGVRLAAELADTAVEEALYRGWVQKSIRKVEQRKRRT